MSDTPKGRALDLKAVAVTPLRPAIDSALPHDDCPRHWCNVMKPEVLDFLRTVNPAYIKILIELGFVRKDMLTKEQQAAIAGISDSALPNPDDFYDTNCPPIRRPPPCPIMNPGDRGWLDKINPADLAVLIKHGFVQESMLSKTQLTALAAIRK